MCPLPPFLDEIAALRLSRLPGVGAARFRSLLALHPSPSDALAAYLPPPSSTPKDPTLDGLQRALDWLLLGGSLLYASGPRYPARLLDLGEPPPVIFCHGDVGALVRPAITVVGGRGANEEVQAAAQRVGARCAALGLGVVSGGARGVDAAALEGCLEAGGQGVVVLGSGVDVSYPPEHEGLFRRCAAQGVVLSELLPGTAPRRSFFVTRNRILAALGGASLLLWGEAGSGALVTVRWARRLGRAAAALAAAGGQRSGAFREARALGAEGLQEDELEGWLRSRR